MEERVLKNGQKLLIKNSEPSEAGRIIDYMGVVGGETDFLSFGSHQVSKTPEQMAKHIAALQKSSNQIHVYGEIEGEIVALLDVIASQKDRLKHSAEFGLTVLKDHWGKGIGTELVTYMMEWAQMSNVLKKINLHVVSNNESAINLYRKFDFSFEGRLTKEFFVNGTYYDMIAMGCWLDDVSS